MEIKSKGRKTNVLIGTTSTGFQLPLVWAGPTTTMIGFKQKQKSESENFRNHSKMQNYISSLKGNENTIQ